MKRATVLAITLIAMLSICAAILFETLHADHEVHCHESDCPVCLILHILKEIIHTAIQHVPAKPIALLTVFFFLANPAQVKYTAETLVSQKMKLTN